MSSSTRKTKKTGTTSNQKTSEKKVSHLTRTISKYVFEYQRDRVSRKAGVSYLRIEGTGTSRDEGLEMTIQEAQSLYNFLGKALNG